MVIALIFISSQDVMGQQTKVKAKNGEIKVQQGGDKITVGDKETGKSDKNDKSDIKADVKSTDNKGKNKGKEKSKNKGKGKKE